MRAEIGKQAQNHDYISDHWGVLAACAWREYQAHGRGALLLGGFDDPEDSIYIPSDLLRTVPFLEDFARFADEYDPCREVVVIFLGEPPKISAFKGGIPERGTPPALYERLKAVLHEN
jgi:hypothetical protein